MNDTLLMVILGSAIFYGTPLLIAALGEVLAERSGVLNLGVEGMMLMGAVVASVELKDLSITEGADVLSLYQFNTNTARHYFCSKCGIYTHHQRRSNPELYAINIACLEGVDPFVLKHVPVLDGEDHPSDTGLAVFQGI